jgi:hypothetical protein
VCLPFERATSAATLTRKQAISVQDIS